MLRFIEGFVKVKVTRPYAMGVRTLATRKSKTMLRMNGIVNFYDVSEDELKAVMKEWKQPGFRVDQIRKYVYDQGVTDFDSMNTLPKALREKLSSLYVRRQGCTING